MAYCAAFANLLLATRINHQAPVCAVSDSASDFYHQKTDAQLLYFVEHPELYQPSLVAAARRELRRRGVQITEPELAVAPALYTPSRSRAPARSSKGGALSLALGGVLLASFISYYVLKEPDQPAPKAKTHKAPPRLVEVPMSVIPNYAAAVAQCVDQQLLRVPAGERAAAKQANQPLRQYRELTKRFWTAQTQTEYVFEQARKNNVTPALAGHVETVMTAWQQWNKATVYGYKFGPAMADHLDLMTRVARQQQEGLADLLLVANNPQPFENEKTKKREADVSDLLSGLLPKSPVTGQPYNTVVRRVQL
jgi:hypothetical protein